MNKLSKIALVGALLVSTLSAASAQTFNGSHDNQPAFNSQQTPADQNKSDVGENGGA
jgi:hypothetical protein